MLTDVKLQDLFRITNEAEFEKIALSVYDFQKRKNPIYQKYLNQIGKLESEIKHIQEIPFLPISFFKTHQVRTFEGEAEAVFTSSGTSGNQSKHDVKDLKVYQDSFETAFKRFYGNPEEMTILALLPSYLEREGSSLIYMVNHLIETSQSLLSGFFLHNTEDLINSLHQAQARKEKILLIGVSFALLDLAENYELDLSNVIVMETGGMKGKREEITRNKLHEILGKSFNVEKIHSEYGMTELLSQAYSKGKGIFECPPWMKVLFRDTYDPFDIGKNAGGVNVIDLANIHSCSFIETSDLGRKVENGFEILGRLDNSDIRGCNLMIQ